MDRIGHVLLWFGLLLVAVLGIWLFIAAREAGAPPDLSDLNPLELLRPEPTPTIYPAAAAVLQSVQSLSDLQTVTYHIERVIVAESGLGTLDFLFADKFMLIAHAEVTAGIDLSEISASDISITDDGTVYLKLPDAKVLHAYLDNERTRVYNRETGLIGQNENLESGARAEAEKYIEQDALTMGILEEATHNAQDVLRSFLLAMGLQHVIFISDAMPTPTPVTTPVGP